MLEKLNPAENTGTQGEDGLKIDMFDVLAEKIKQEIEVLINCSSLCLSLPTSGQGSSSHKQSRDGKENAVKKLICFLFLSL